MNQSLALSLTSVSCPVNLGIPIFVPARLRRRIPLWVKKREVVILEVSVSLMTPPRRFVDRCRLVALDPAAAGRAAAGSRVSVQRHVRVPQHCRVPSSAEKRPPQPVPTAQNSHCQLSYPPLVRGLLLLPGVAVVAHVAVSYRTCSRTWPPCRLEASTLLHGHLAPHDQNCSPTIRVSCHS